MPTISIKTELLFDALGRRYTEDEFSELCFEFGLELDEVTSEKEMIAKEQGAEKSVGASEELIYRIEIPANRYDLLCMEGLVTALKIFKGKCDIPKFVKYSPANSCQLIVKPNTQLVRPFAVAAILRNITFTKESYDSFIDLQDKLHQNIGRRRTLIAIGTHDLDTIEGPFTYDAQPPKEIKFKPLNQKREYTAEEMMELYSKDSHLKPYLPIIRDKPVYPIIYDRNGVVVSMPPIINGDHSKITLNTRNVLIEVTGVDLNKTKIVLDTMVCMFSQHCPPVAAMSTSGCETQYTIEAVDVVAVDGSKHTYPSLEYREEEMFVDYINSRLGIDQSSEELTQLLNKMGLKSHAVDGATVKVTVPPTRHDILHACDIMEDVGIAYGYNNITRTSPNAPTIGQQFLLNKVSDQFRHELSRCGFTEILTFSLCSEDDVAKKMRSLKVLESAVKISNPKTIEFEIARTSLIPGLLKSVASNKKMPLPLKLFEISDVVLRDQNKDVGARNERRLCAVNYNKTPGFEVIHGLLDRIMQVSGIEYSPKKTNVGYYISKLSDERFLAGRCAEIVVNGAVVGVMGVLHPEVIINFELMHPCAVLEISLESMEMNV